MLEFLQINLKKAFTAAVELNKRVNKSKQYVFLATETYNFRGKICSLPRGSKSVCSENCRAAIIFNGSLNLIKIEKLTKRDCAVGLLLVNNEKILIASVYMDIKEKTIQPWLTDVINFARRKKYSLIIGADSNSHSVLFGNESNSRGEELEEFIINNSLLVENILSLIHI